MQATTTQIQIARLSIGRVAGAYKKFNKTPVPGIDKVGAVKWLAEQVESNHLTISEIEGAEPSTLTGVDPAIGAKVDATSSVASKAQADALNALTKVADLEQSIKTIAKVIDTEKKTVAQMGERIGAIKIDDRSLQKVVDKVIADHFGKFAKVVEDANAQTVVADLTKVRPMESRTCAEVFGIEVKDVRGNPLKVDIWNAPDAPAVDPDFIWTEPILRHLVLSDVTGENLWFGGEKGTGKSETARQFAAKTGRSFKRINFHKHTTVEEYIGAVGIEDGKTVFQPKDFLTAYASPSTVILLDEITNADPGELATLNGFLEPNAAVSFGGITHKRAPGVLVFVADNTFGSGDDSGRHAGTRMQNSALVDRFARVIPFTFLPEQFEIDAICRRSGCTKALATHVHKAITLARQKVAQAEIVDAPSIRSAIAFCRAVQVLPVRDAWESTIVARQPSESHAALQGVYEAAINPTLVESNI